MPVVPDALPTDAELQVLRVLWARGPSTVREVHDALGAEKGTGYTTTLKLLQNMHGKGLALRDDSERQHVYVAAVAEEPTLGALLGRLIDRVFDGSAASLVVRALGARPASPEEARALRRMLARLEKPEATEPAARQAPPPAAPAARRRRR
jgi:BlaI family transcriptional regulator, penicillinase repressor